MRRCRNLFTGFALVLLMGTLFIGCFSCDLLDLGDDGSGFVPPPQTDLSPVARFTYQPLIADVDSFIRFDASGSFDREGAITSYAWGFGDGTSAWGPTVYKAYPTARTYNVRLSVYDESGNYSYCDQPVCVTSGFAAIGGPLPDPVSAPEILIVDLVYSATDPAADYIVIAATEWCNLRGYRILSSTGYSYVFLRDIQLGANDVAFVYSGAGVDTGSVSYWGALTDVWGNTSGSAWLYDPSGRLLDSWSYQRIGPT